MIKSIMVRIISLSMFSIFFLLTLSKLAYKRLCGLKSIFYARINDHIHNYNKFYIPSYIQRKFKRILFWRTLLKRPDLFKEQAQNLHDEMLAFVQKKEWKPLDPLSVDILDWSMISSNQEFFYKNYVKLQKPCVIRNFPFDKEFWTLENIMNIWGDQPIATNDLAYGNTGPTYNTTLKEIKERNLEGSTSTYVSFDRTFFNLNRDNCIKTTSSNLMSKLLKKDSKYSVGVDIQLFISLKSNHPKFKSFGSPMHCANNLNMFMNISGKKKWILVDPEFSFGVYPLAPEDISLNYVSFLKWASLHEKEKHLYPLYDFIPKYEVDLNDGDVLFVPCWWWHSVEALTSETISLACRHGLPFLGSLYPTSLKDPNSLFTTLQVLDFGLMRFIYDALHSKVKNKIVKNTTLKQELFLGKLRNRRDLQAQRLKETKKNLSIWRKL